MCAPPLADFPAVFYSSFLIYVTLMFVMKHSPAKIGLRLFAIWIEELSLGFRFQNAKNSPFMV